MRKTTLMIRRYCVKVGVIVLIFSVFVIPLLQKHETVRKDVKAKYLEQGICVSRPMVHDGVAYVPSEPFFQNLESFAIYIEPDPILNSDLDYKVLIKDAIDEAYKECLQSYDVFFVEEKEMLFTQQSKILGISIEVGYDHSKALPHDPLINFLLYRADFDKESKDQKWAQSVPYSRIKEAKTYKRKMKILANKIKFRHSY